MADQDLSNDSKVFRSGERTFLRQGARAHRFYEIKEQATRVPSLRAQIALDMVSRWGTIAGEEGDTLCHQSSKKLMSPEALVDRGIKVADELVTRLELLGWFDAVPDPEDLYNLRNFDADEDDNPV